MERLRRLGGSGGDPPDERGPMPDTPDVTDETIDSPWSGTRRQSGNLPLIRGFRIVREVGRGGMGVVYDAVEQALGRQVALKVLAAHAGGGTGAERFRREARAAARLHHTNIVPVFGAGEDRGLLYYAMQFIDGEGLDRYFGRLRQAREPDARLTSLPPDPYADRLVRRLLDPLGRDWSPSSGSAVDTPPDDLEASTVVSARPGGGGVPPAKAAPATEEAPRSSSGSLTGTQFRMIARIGWQVAEALAYAHNQGVLHRDIKPSNILIDVQGAVWVADFGLAKAAEEGENLTQTGDVVGTIRYMAPERFDGRSDVRGDVYSLGVTLYELLTLRPMFREGQRAQLIEKVLRDEPPRPRSVDRSIPPDLETIVLKALAKEPEARYPTAAAMAEDLRRYCAGETILARRVGPAERAWRWSRRNPAIASLVLTLGMVLSVGLLAMTVLWSKAVSRGAAARAGYELARQTARAQTIQSARLEMDVGTRWARDGWVGRGLLWIDRGLRTSPPDASALRLAGRVDGAAWAAVAAVPRAAFGHKPTLRFAFDKSPDGRTLAVAAADGIHLWDLASGGHLRVLPVPGPDEMPTFCPDGRRIVTTSTATGIRLWDADTGALLRTLVERTAPRNSWEYIQIAGFTPDGEALIAADRIAGTARVVALADGRQLGKTIQDPLPGERPFDLSPGAGRIVRGSSNGQAQAWDLTTGEPIGRPTGPGTPVAALIAPAGDLFVTLGGARPESGFVQIVDAGTSALRARIPTPSKVEDILFRPDGRSMLVFEQSGSAHLYDLAKGREIGSTIRAPSGFVRSDWSKIPPAAFSPDGQTVATAHADRSVRLWDVETGQAIGPILEHAATVRQVAFRPDGRTLLTAEDDGVVRIWDLAPAFAGRVMPGPLDFEAIDLSPDGRTLAFASDGLIRLVDRETGLPTAPPILYNRLAQVGPPVAGSPGYVRVVRFSPDGRVLAAGGDDALVHLWVAATGKPVATLTHDHWVLCLAFSPDGKSLATGTTAKYAQIWDVASGEPLSFRLSRPSPDVSNEICRLGFRGDGRVLFTVGSSDAIRFWDVRDGSLIDREADLGTMIEAKAVALSPDGKLLVVRTDRETRAWDLDGPRPIPAEFGPDKNGFAFSPDSRRLVALGETSARVRDVASGAQVGAVMEHPAAPTVAGFSRDGSLVVTGAFDGKVRLWDAATGRPIGPPLYHGRKVDRLLFTPDGRSVLAIGGRVTTWPLPAATAGDPSAVARGLSMNELDEQGEIRPLPLDRWKSPAVGGPIPSDLAGSIALHDRLAALYTILGRDEAALWHLDRLIALRPGTWSDLARRSEVYRRLERVVEADADAARVEALAPADRSRAWQAPNPRPPATGEFLSVVLRRGVELATLGRWPEAKIDLGRVLDHPNATTLGAQRVALIHLAIGDEAGYRETCRAAWGVHRETKDPGVANNLAWLCSLGVSGIDQRGLVLLARRAAREGSMRGIALNTLGAALYRGQGLGLGVYSEAIDAINEGIRLRGDSGEAQDWAFLAMAHARLGHGSEARRHYSRLVDWQPDQDPRAVFNNLEVAILRREAESVVRPDFGFPARGGFEDR